MLSAFKCSLTCFLLLLPYCWTEKFSEKKVMWKLGANKMAEKSSFSIVENWIRENSPEWAVIRQVETRQDFFTYSHEESKDKVNICSSNAVAPAAAAAANWVHYHTRALKKVGQVFCSVIKYNCRILNNCFVLLLTLLCRRVILDSRFQNRTLSYFAFFVFLLLTTSSHQIFIAAIFPRIRREHQSLVATAAATILNR